MCTRCKLQIWKWENKQKNQTVWCIFNIWIRTTYNISNPPIIKPNASNIPLSFQSHPKDEFRASLPLITWILSHLHVWNELILKSIISIRTNYSWEWMSCNEKIAPSLLFFFFNFEKYKSICSGFFSFNFLWFCYSNIEHMYEQMYIILCISRW